MRHRLIQVLMVCLALAGGLWTWLSRPGAGAGDTDSPAAARVGALAPDFRLATLDGRVVALSDLRGQAVVLNFWATWCPPCRAEMAALEQAGRTAQSRGAVVLGVNQGEPAAQVEGFAREQQLTFTIALDETGEVNRAYRVLALPTTYFLDRAGVIRDIVYGGPMTRALIESKIASLRP